MAADNEGNLHTSKDVATTLHTGENKSAINIHLSTRPDVKTFMYDNDLPKLPLPSLKTTLQRYIESCHPFLSDEELQSTKETVNKFEKGEGQDLYRMLVQRADNKQNWLEDWWLRYAYLNMRTPLIPYLSTGGLQTLQLSTMPPSPDKYIEYACLFLYTTLAYFEALRDERISPQFTMKGSMLSMDQFRRLFNTCRIPGEETDSLYTCWKTKKEGKCPEHVVVLCHGHIWTIVPFDQETGGLLPLSALEKQMSHIRATSDMLGEGQAVATLTADDRDSWAKNRVRLVSLSSNNRRLLQKIEEAAFVMVLDDTFPQDMAQASWHCICGDTRNRWADKSLTGVTTKSGYVLLNNDHTPFDAMVLVVLTHFQQSVMKTLPIEELRTAPIKDSMPLPVRQLFDLDQHFKQEIQRVGKASKEIVDNILVNFMEFKDFGKNWTKRNKIHPDGFLQMSFQLAYYRTYQSIAPTYETATTRQFYHGRTETIRSCTPEAKLFVQTMEDPNATSVAKAGALRQACVSHERLMRECQDGEGVDRLLLGLYLAALEDGRDVPSLFTDPAFVKTGGGGNYVLSTSTLGSTDGSGGAAPMVQHGYGCFYSILSHKVYLFITSYKDGGTVPAQQFTEVIASCLRDMSQLLETVMPSKL